MRVLFVTQGYLPAIGGTERVVQRSAEELATRFGDEVAVFTTDCLSGEAFADPAAPRLAAGWDEVNGIRVRRFRVARRLARRLGGVQRFAYRHRAPFNQHLRSLHGGPIVPGLARAIRRFPADVIVASSFPLRHMFVAARAAAATGRPCVFLGGLHPDDDWGFGRPMIHDAIRRATGYVAYTAFEAEHVVRQGAAPERVFTLGVGVDPEPFTAVDRAAARARLGLGDEPLVGYVGQLGGHKGIDALLRAMPLVWRDLPGAHVLVAGARARYAETLERVVAGWPAEHRARLHLRFDFAEEEKPALFAALDALAYPSGYESFGIAFLEAWACGTPVIGCRRGAIPSVVAAGRDGLLVDYQDEGMLAEAILLLLRNPRWARSLGEAGRRKTLDLYTWERVAARYREVLEHAIRDARRRSAREEEIACPIAAGLAQEEASR